MSDSTTSPIEWSVQVLDKRACDQDSTRGAANTVQDSPRPLCRRKFDNRPVVRIFLTTRRRSIGRQIDIRQSRSNRRGYLVRPMDWIVTIRSLGEGQRCADGNEMAISRCWLGRTGDTNCCDSQSNELWNIPVMPNPTCKQQSCIDITWHRGIDQLRKLAQAGWEFGSRVLSPSARQGGQRLVICARDMSSTFTSDLTMGMRHSGGRVPIRLNELGRLSKRKQLEC